MFFEKAILLGNGKIASDCLLSLLTKNIDIEVIESQYSQLSNLKLLCKKHNVKFNSFESQKQLMDYIFFAAANKKTLIISANNEHIIPKNICSLSNTTIINFHYSYLPDYRGMNIPTWVIYNGEKYTGVTWHYINSEIDAGKIISQEKIFINENTRAIDIVKEGMTIGKRLFDSFVDVLLENSIDVCIENDAAKTRTYFRKELPENGIILENGDQNIIEKMLRAFDYGPVSGIPKLKININDKLFDIQKYRIYKNGILLVGSELWKENHSIASSNYSFDLLINK